MPKDYRHSKRTQNRRSKPAKRTSPAFWMFIGFTPGLILATLTYIDTHKIKNLPSKSQDTISFLSDSTNQNNNVKHQVSTKAKDKKKTLKKTKVTPIQETEIEYSFFTELKKREEIVSVKDVEKEAKATAKEFKQKLRKLQAKKRKERAKIILKKEATTKQKNDSKNSHTNSSRTKPKVIKQTPPLKNNYVLQVGSFRTKTHALTHQKRLNKLGVNTKIETVKLKGNQWFRVSVGPFNRFKDIKKNLQRLKKNKISAITVKLK